MLTKHMRDLTGVRSGRLVAIRCIGVDHEGRAEWLCKCDCGNEKAVKSNNLVRRAGTKSCGCLRREANASKKRPNGWNTGKVYTIAGGQHVYKTRKAWADGVVRTRGNRCERCGWARARCDVHHIVSKAEGGLNTIENAIVLCPNFHREEHEGERT
jgi:hypothetical protein